MLLVGLTGGIGSGKSTVAGMLAERGAVIFDADTFARHALDPGTRGYQQVLETFGPQLLTAEGDIDREALAALVFADPEGRRRLEAIVHPEVARLFQESVEPYRGTDNIVVYSVPLLVEAGLQSAFDVVVVVIADEDSRVGRLARDRRMSEEAARARIRVQASDEERERVADLLIDNGGSVEDLERQVERVWQQLLARSSRPPAGGQGDHPETA
jgi:dephospho-CoA kinase